ncbi:MAG: sulfite oxidase-like oxidoreductase [Myxococcaceae bacterium]|nr:sulfite oxidase-like oxidoreductase [Myxococcaceae bacterium]
MAESDAEKLQRIVEARMKLRDRHLKRIESSPARSDPNPLGSGERNRHGMPRLPPGQHLTKSWPVLDLGVKPEVSTSAWRLTVDGAVDAPVTLDWAAFQALPQVKDDSDFHCVTTWSLMDSTWTGVPVSTVLALAQPKAEATHLMTYAADGYTTNLPIEEALKDDVLLVHAWNGQPLTKEHGGPVRMITPQLYAWKGAKWINRIELLTKDRPGFWEVRGYSMTAHPWRDDRYS